MEMLKETEWGHPSGNKNTKWITKTKHPELVGYNTSREENVYPKRWQERGNKNEARILIKKVRNKIITNKKIDIKIDLNRDQKSKVGFVQKNHRVNGSNECHLMSRRLPVSPQQAPLPPVLGNRCLHLHLISLCPAQMLLYAFTFYAQTHKEILHTFKSWILK